MKSKPKKTKAQQSQKNIEVSFGGEDITKYDIMKAIAKRYTVYGATVWLNTPIEKLKSKTPAELMMKGLIKEVQKFIEESDDFSS